MKIQAMTFVVSILSGLVLLQTPAMASVSDTALYYSLQNRRLSLISRESDLMRSRETLQRNIDELSRRNEQNKYTLRINLIARDLDSVNNDIQKTRLDIRDVERAMN
jgi:hypothetical protein